MSIDVYLINLDRRPDRLTHVEAQLKNIGLPFHRFSAIDGADELAPVAPVRRHRFIVNQKKAAVRGELACAASHIEVWKKFLKSNADFSLILEDDIKIDPGLKGILDNHHKFVQYDFLNISSNVPYRLERDALEDFLRAGSLERPSFLDFKRRRQWKRLEWRRRWRIFALSPVPHIGLVCECDPAPALASGYIVSRKAARNFIIAAQNLSYPIDLVWRNSSGHLRQGFLAEPVVRQVGSDTDILGRYDQSRMPLIYRLLRPFLKNRRWKRRWDVIWLYGLLKQ